MYRYKAVFVLHHRLAFCPTNRIKLDLFLMIYAKGLSAMNTLGGR